MQILRNVRRSALTMVEVMALEKRDQEEELELKKFILEENMASTARETATSVGTGIIGRQTGTAEWKAARGEDGTKH
jgi:hypothetical protein